MKILIIDNYDSFTYNLYQYVGDVGKIVPQVEYNDKITWKQFVHLRPDAVIISPGPGNPTNKKDFGISAEVIAKVTVPILGVCLGHQGIGALYGSKVVHAPEIMHGRTSKIYHTGKGLFRGIPQGFEAVRYHSLVLKNVPQYFTQTAWTEDGIIMGIEHTSRPVWGVQFHPESIGTQCGKQLILNFLNEVISQ